MHDTDLPSGPLVLLDAMALGKPIVATDVNRVRDYIPHEVTGILVAPADIEALTQGLTRLDGDDELRQRLGAEARTTCEDDLAPRVFWPRLRDVVQDILLNVS